MRCHHITDTDGTRVFIPGCWGGAIGGHNGIFCTCYNRKSEKPTNTKDKQIRDLQDEVIILNRTISNLTKKLRKQND